MEENDYLMENPDEIFRLETKTDVEVVRRQALWAGLLPGMTVADIGCGVGKTTSVLGQLVQPGGRAVGLDGSSKRLDYARQHYGNATTEFACRDLQHEIDDLGPYDFIWVRFLLEYYRTGSFELVRRIASLLKPGGILCLIDLDHNCMNHSGLSPQLERTIHQAIKIVEEKCDFDPYAGRKLYSYLYDLGFKDIRVDVSAHHLIYGDLADAEAFNWMKKIEVASTKLNFGSECGDWGFAEFQKEFRQFFENPRRFTYTPLIMCRGTKP